MATTAAIMSAVVAAGASTVSTVNANRARKDAQGAADRQAKLAEAAQDKIKAQEAQETEAMFQKRKLEKENQAIAARSGFASTVSPGGATVGGSVSAGQGQKTLIGS